MARTLGLETVAEGVESRTQAELLSQEGCDCAQGFFYYRPVPRDELFALIEAETAGAARRDGSGVVKTTKA